MKINFCSAPSGSGKTHQIANRSRYLAKGFNKVLILQPTRDLLGNTAAKEIHPILQIRTSGMSSSMRSCRLFVTTSTKFLRRTTPHHEVLGC